MTAQVVRVTINGTLAAATKGRSALSFSGGTVLLKDGAADWSAEFIRPARTWTDGDVVQQSEELWTLTRERGQWLSTRRPQNPGYWTDDMVTDHLEDKGAGWGHLVVLRYQAAE